MPELPEVETIARGLRGSLIGRTIAQVTLHRRSIFRGNPRELEPLLGATFVAIQRAGKYLVFELRKRNARWQLMVHLGMTGRLIVEDQGDAVLKHTHLMLDLDDGRALRFSDPRRFGKVALAPAPEFGFAAQLGVAQGAEPLEVSASEFARLFGRRAAPIKNALLNQRLLRGVGNIYADESLHRTGLAPHATQVSRPRLERLRLALRAVLEEAIAAGGSSISDYVGSDGAPGLFHLEHRVYGREGEPCPRCRGRIRRIVLAGRSAHYCPRCQRA